MARLGWTAGAFAIATSGRSFAVGPGSVFVVTRRPNKIWLSVAAAWAAVVGPVNCTTASAQTLTVYGYDGATNMSPNKSSSSGPIEVNREGVAEYFANNQTYKNVAKLSATADYGVNKVYSGAITKATSFITSSASSSWSDYFVVKSVTSTGFIRALLDISSDLDATTGSAAAAASYRLLAGSFAYDERSNLDSAFGYEFTSSGAASTQYITQGPDSHRLVTVMIPYKSGQSFLISSTLGCYAYASFNNVASCDAGHSTYWGGIVDVTDAQGNVVTNWTLTSQSGTDYTRSFVPTSVAAAVPEPATWALMLVGFGAIGGTLRSRRRYASALAA